MNWPQSLQHYLMSLSLLLDSIYPNCISPILNQIYIQIFPSFSMLSPLQILILLHHKKALSLLLFIMVIIIHFMSLIDSSIFLIPHNHLVYLDHILMAYLQLELILLNFCKREECYLTYYSNEINPYIDYIFTLLAGSCYGYYYCY